MSQCERPKALGTEFRMTNMLQEMSDCIRTMSNANGDNLCITTIENQLQTHVVVAHKRRARGRGFAAIFGKFE